MEKRAISAIVATVLLILIVVGGVTIVYVGILPMFGGLNNFNYHDVNIGISLEGYTLYDPDTSYVFVQVQRGSDDVDLVGLEIIFHIGGNSLTYEIEEDNVPLPNQKATYAFYLGDLDFEGEPDSVSVSPIIRDKDGNIGVLDVVSRVILPRGDIDLTLERELEASERKPKGFWDGWIKLSGCAVLDVEGGKYYLDDNFEGTGSGSACLKIVSDDIVLDLNKKSVIAGGTESFILADSVSGAVISKGYIDGAGVDKGIWFSNVENSNISSVSIDGTIDNSIFIEQGGRNTISDVFINNSGNDGLEISKSDYNHVFNFTAESCLDEGLEIEESSFNKLEDIGISNSKGNGIKVSGLNTFDVAEGNELTNVHVYSSSVDGVELKYVKDTIIRGLNTHDNSKDGLKVQYSSENNFSNIISERNYDDGIQLEYSHNNHLYNLTLSINPLFLRASNDNTLNSFNISNAYYGVVSNQHSSRNSFSNFNISSSHTGLYVGEEDKGGNNNLFFNGIISGSYYGVYLYSSSSNRFLDLKFENVLLNAFYIRKKTSVSNHFDDIALCGSSVPYVKFRCPKTTIYEYYAGKYTYCTNTVEQSNVFVSTC